ncbi:metal ABC transporter substrate-binding protein [Haloprofundus sp. MHR1]|uniref:metal ABC transporter substrate-binding protein n=1 Tax=Haloprofundus sp. MHR1 TaxID=2572921 RepID=UPI0010BEB8D1|nr:metal ABC transporter substrate-binding protein [Haloprofundus sp. MHR1]QCJ46187.1 zinc ABC transporter substrate-binding protein [Haloprofundus sp. MHR1]
MSLHNRRDVLGMGAGLLTAALAGCTDTNASGGSSGANGEDEPTAQASFFVLSDFASSVAGDAAAVENLVPFGQHGHGWEPGPDLQRTVLQSDAFVYMGEGFQPWADNVVTNLEDAESDVAVIEARHGVDLLGAPSDGDDHGDEAHQNETHEEEHHNESEDSGGREHEHSDADPHFWLDPTRAATAVETIRDGFAEFDESNANVYAENADAYVQTLEELDATFEERLSGRQRDDVLVAGHNALQYLDDRYGFHVHALTGLSPDDQPSAQDITRAQGLVEEHGITHVFAPVFESDRAARQLVEETDAEDTLPVTSIPGVTEEWNEKGWGYVEVMREVNLGSLETALGAE